MDGPERLKVNTNSRRTTFPGPQAAGGLPWAGMDSFFDHDVQVVLLTRKDYLGWPIKCWEAVEEVTNRRHPIPGRKIVRQYVANEDQKQEIWRIRWSDFANRYSRDPDFVAQLFLAMTSFHAVRPKEWPLALKLSHISVLCEANIESLRPGPPLRNQRKAEVLKKWFGNDLTPSRISIEMSRERKRRLRIHTKWQSHYNLLNQLIEKRFTTHTRNTEKL